MSVAPGRALAVTVTPVTEANGHVPGGAVRPAPPGACHVTGPSAAAAAGITLTLPTTLDAGNALAPARHRDAVALHRPGRQSRS